MTERSENYARIMGKNFRIKKEQQAQVWIVTNDIVVYTMQKACN